jgi:hypothetical protein
LRFKPVGGDAFDGTGKTEKAKAALALLQKHDDKELKKAPLSPIANCSAFHVAACRRVWNVLPFVPSLIAVLLAQLL